MLDPHYQEFLDWQAFKRTEAAEKTQMNEHEPNADGNPTIGCSSDPTVSPKETCSSAGRDHTPNIGSASTSVEPSREHERSQSQTFRPLSRSPGPPISKKTLKNRTQSELASRPSSSKPTLENTGTLWVPSGRGKLPGYLPSNARSPLHFPVAHHTPPEYKPTQHSSFHSPARSQSPALLETRSQTPSSGAPLPHSSAPHYQTKDDKKCSPSPEEPTPLHEYDTCPTSYLKRSGQRGGRKKITIDGKEEVDRTEIERLIHRSKKHKDVCKNGHLFGKKHGCYFNPYTYSKVNAKICKLIERPKGFQNGRGNNPIHELIGLRGDYDYMCEILASSRKACIKFRPRRVQLEAGEGLTWRHYSSGDREAIHNYASADFIVFLGISNPVYQMYKRYPFLYHFRNQSGEDSWVIIAMCVGYLSANRQYVRSGHESKASLYLNLKGKARTDDEEEEEDEEVEDDYKHVDIAPEYLDDYARNAALYTSSSGAGSFNGTKRSLPRPEATSPDYENPQPSKKAKQPFVERSPSPRRLFPKPTRRSGDLKVFSTKTAKAREQSGVPYGTPHTPRASGAPNAYYSADFSPEAWGVWGVPYGAPDCSRALAVFVELGIKAGADMSSTSKDNAMVKAKEAENEKGKEKEGTPVPTTFKSSIDWLDINDSGDSDEEPARLVSESVARKSNRFETSPGATRVLKVDTRPVEMLSDMRSMCEESEVILITSDEEQEPEQKFLPRNQLRSSSERPSANLKRKSHYLGKGVEEAPRKKEASRATESQPEMNELKVRLPNPAETSRASVSRQDEFSFQLAQWLLDQLDSEEQLKITIQQFSVLISQAQNDAIQELYLHIARLIFHKFLRAEPQSAQLFAQLCRSLFLTNLKRHSDPFTRPVPIHEHLLRCFLVDLSSDDTTRNPRTQQSAGSTDESSGQSETLATGVFLDGNRDRIVKVSSLILELHKNGLISTMWVYEYMFKLTTRFTSKDFGGLLGAIYALLGGCFSHLDASVWRGELEFIQDRVKDLVSEAGAGQGREERIQQLTNLFSRTLNRGQGLKLNASG